MSLKAIDTQRYYIEVQDEYARHKYEVRNFLLRGNGAGWTELRGSFDSWADAEAFLRALNFLVVPR